MRPNYSIYIFDFKNIQEHNTK